MLVEGFVFDVGKTDITYLLRQGHLGGEEDEVVSLSMCSGNPSICRFPSPGERLS
jgi:hypothetical protein